MGNRANIRIMENDEGDIYLYTHWGGSELPLTLRSALIRGRKRWDDPTYLNRIIFSEMVKGDIDGVTGFGLSTYETDNDRTGCIELHHNSKTVQIGERLWSFQQYIDDPDLADFKY